MLQPPNHWPSTLIFVSWRIFLLLSLSSPVISLPSAIQTLIPSWWPQNEWTIAKLSIDISECLCGPVSGMFDRKMLSRATFPLLPHLQPIWLRISLRGALANTDHRGITHTKWPQDCLRSSFLLLAVNSVGFETRVSQDWKASRDQWLIVVWV